MPDIKRTVQLVTTQHVRSDLDEGSAGFPMREWTITVYLVGPEGDPLPATCYEKATYNLHETFGKRAKQTFKNAPFEIRETGWGEFEMSITLTPIGNPKGGDHTLKHDLNFQQERYEATHSVTFRNPKPELVERLKESAPVGELANGAGAGRSEKKRQKQNRTVDMEKLADALPQLSDDDLLQVVQMVHDNKSEETYTKNDVENGEFHVDLYTLPDPLIKMLWDFTEKRVDMNVVT